MTTLCEAKVWGINDTIDFDTGSGQNAGNLLDIYINCNGVATFELYANINGVSYLTSNLVIGIGILSIKWQVQTTVTSFTLKSLSIVTTTIAIGTK